MGLDRQLLGGLERDTNVEDALATPVDFDAEHRMGFLSAEKHSR